MSRASFSNIIKHLIIRNLLVIVAFVFTLFLWQTPSALAAFPVGWTYHKAITIAHEHIASDLVDFPLLVNIIADTDLGTHATSSAADIRFATGTGMLLSYEREEYHVSSGSGSGIFWVKIPRLSSAQDTIIYLYYGKSDATDGGAATAVWDSNFKGVWHLTDGTDATVNANTGTTRTGTAPISPGQVSDAYEFPGYAHALISTAYVPTGVTHTMSTWVRFDDLSTWHSLMGSHDAANHRIFIDQNTGTGMSMGFGNAYQTLEVEELQTGAWYHIAASGNGSLATLYINGVSVGNMAYSQTGNNSNIFLIGARTYNGSWMGHLHGAMDEVRLSNTARSADWIAFEYLNMSSNESTVVIDTEKQGIVWSGAGADDHWSTAANWIGGMVPTSADDVLFDDTTFDTAIVDTSFGGTIRSLTLSSVFTGSVKLMRSLTITGDVSLAGGAVDMRGSGYTLKVNGSWVNTDAVFRAGTGTVLLTGTGSHTFTEANTLHNLTLNDGLVGYWKFDEGAGTRAMDSSGYGNNVTLTNGPIWIANADNAISFANPYALRFDGTNDRVNISNPSFIHDRKGTISAWVSVDNYESSRRTIFGKAGDGGWNYFNNLELSINTNGSIRLKIYDSVGVVTNITTTQRVMKNTWHHVVAVSDNFTNMTHIYLDGAIAGTSQSSIWFGDILTPTRPSFYIGAWNPSINSTYMQYMDGLLDDIRIYNRALSASEIAALAAGNQPSTALGTYTMGSVLDIDGDLTLSTGALDVSSSNYSINVAGNWQNDGGVFTARSGTVTLDGTGSILFAGESSFATLSLAQEDPSLIGYWKFDEGADAIAYDSSGYGYHGTLMGGQSSTGWTTATASTRFPNPYALEFDGMNDYVDTGLSVLPNIAYSASAWVKITGDNSDMGDSESHAILNGAISSSSNERIRLRVERNGEVTFLDDYGVVIVGTGFEYGEWYHIVATYDFPNQSANLYLNGTLIGNDSLFTQAPATVLGEFWIGERADIGTQNGEWEFNLKGFLDDIRIYNRALSATEVSRLASGYASPSPITLGSALSVSSSLTLDSSSWLDLDTYTLTAPTATISNLGLIDEGTGKIIHSSSLSAPTAVTAGDTITLTLTDSDENIDGSTPDTVTVMIDGETVTLTETGNATGIFTSTIRSEANRANTVGDGIISRDDACSYTVGVSYSDAQDSSDTASATIAVTDPVTLCPMPSGGGSRGGPGRGGAAPALTGGRSVNPEEVTWRSDVTVTEEPSEPDASEEDATKEDEAKTEAGLQFFSDVPTSLWFASFVHQLAADGIVRGYSDENGTPTGLFGPSDPVTFAEIITMGLRAIGEEPPGSDLIPRNLSARGTWASESIQAAEKWGIPVLHATLDVHAPAKRGEVVAILLHLFGVATDDPPPASYADLPADHPYRDEILRATALGILQGDSDAEGHPLGTVRPDDPINRAEVAKIVLMMKEWLR